MHIKLYSCRQGMVPVALSSYRQTVIRNVFVLLLWGCSCTAQADPSITPLTLSDVVAGRSNLVR